MPLSADPPVPPRTLVEGESPMLESIDKPRFFILGCPRSGTTLMRLVLESHSRVHCFDEWQGYLALATNTYEVPSAKQLVGFKVPAWTEQLRLEHLSDPMSGEYTVPSFYRGEPIVFMFREVRDTVASMFRLGWLEDESWVRVIPDLKYKIDHLEWFRAQYARELRQLDESQHARYAAGALFWKYKTAAFFEYQAAGLPVLGIRYEDVAHHPERELRRVVEFLGLEWEEGLLNHPAQEHTELDSSGYAIAFTDPKRQIDTTSIGSWQKVLSLAQAEEIMAIVGDLHQEIYPASADSHVSAGERAADAQMDASRSDQS